MRHYLYKAFAAFLLMTTVGSCVCSIKIYESMNRQYQLVQKKIEDAYNKRLIVKNNYEYFSGNLSIINDFLNTYYNTTTQPINAATPDDTQCDSMENQISDLLIGLKHTLEVQMPEQAEPIAPLAPQKEAQGPSPQQSVPTDVIPNPSQPFVETPKSSVMTDTPPTPSMAPQQEPKASIPSY